LTAVLPAPRRTSAILLLTTGHPAAVELLITLLNNPVTVLEPEATRKLLNQPLTEPAILWQQFIQLLKQQTVDVKLSAIQAIQNLPADLARPAWIPFASLLEDQAIRYEVLKALAEMKIEKSPLPAEELAEKLEKILFNPQEEISLRFLALKAIKPLINERIAANLLPLLQLSESGNDRLLALETVVIFGQIQEKTALNPLKTQLEQLKHCKDEWRQQRDRDFTEQTTANTCESAELKPDEKNRWPFTQWETELGYAIARIDSTAGRKLLKHDLANVRKGAWIALAEKTDTQLLKELITLRENDEQGNRTPIIQYASYRAIDGSLIHFERDGTAQDLPELQKMFGTAQDKAVKERLEWTIEMLKYRLSK